MRQEGFTKTTVSALFLENPKIKPIKTLATNHLKIDKVDDPAVELYNYASDFGMFNYLQGHSQIDISFPVS